MLFQTANFLYFLSLVVKISDCANILYVVPFTSKSHNIMLKPIGLELARRGHNVTVITGYVHHNPPSNYTQIAITNIEIWDIMDIKRPNIFTTSDWSDEKFHNTILWKGGLSFTELVLKSKQMQDFLKNDNKFDLVIVEQFYQEALYMLAHKYKAPLVLVTTFGTCMRHNIMTNHPLQFATIKNEFMTLKKLDSFWVRLRNFYFSFYEYFWYKHSYLSKHEELVRRYISGLTEPVPSLFDIQRNYSLMLVNRHFSYDAPVALLPNVVEIGGVHLAESGTQLPEDLQKLLDTSKKGVVYVSLGSNVRSVELPAEKLNAFLNVFKKFNDFNFIWKWEDEQMTNKSDNLSIRKWLPQRDILRHPKVKAFISHGGLISTQEAVYNGVPIIGIPIYCDQYRNVLTSQKAGFGRMLEFKNINEQNLEEILQDVLFNDKYTRNAKQILDKFKDRPMTPLNTSMFWIEYVIRHKGANHLKNPSLDMSFISYHMIDVFMLVAILTFLIFYILYKIQNIIFILTTNVKLKKLS